MNRYTKNQTIIQSGEPFVCFYIIADGTVTATHDSSEATEAFTLKKGDVIGIFDFGYKEYSFTYTASSDVVVIPYSLTSFAHLPNLLGEEKELGHFLTLSMVQNVLKVLNHYQNLISQQEKLYLYLNTAVSQYQQISKVLGLPMKSIPNKDRLLPLSLQQEEPAFWTETYYQAIRSSLGNRNPLFSNSSYVTGLLARSVDDIHHILYLYFHLI